MPIAHGPLMVSGFLGTLIALERAVALRSRWTYLGPLLTGLGGLSLAVGIGGESGPILITLGSAGLLLVFFVIMRRHFALYTVVMALGALFCLALKGLEPIVASADRVVEALSCRCGEGLGWHGVSRKQKMKYDRKNTSYDIFNPEV
ncbi:MAG TPA: hypothetical protein VI776_01545 [Anaerolineales bacterium]|nr:hypothetical protein [Anaerolineales bacterium]